MEACFYLRAEKKGNCWKIQNKSHCDVAIVRYAFYIQIGYNYEKS